MADLEALVPPRKSFWSAAQRDYQVGVSALILVMLIPLAMISGVLSDRLLRRSEAVWHFAGSAASWPKLQAISTGRARIEPIPPRLPAPRGLDSIRANLFHGTTLIGATTRINQIAETEE